MADQSGAFEALLNGCLSAENDVRSQAEEAYKLIPDATKLEFLLNSTKKDTLPVEVRKLAAVLLRRVLTSSFDEFWPSLGVETQNTVKRELLSQIETVTEQSVRKKICEALAELARNLLDESGNNAWPECLQFLFNAANSTNADIKECALSLFGSVPGIFGNQQAQYLNVIKGMLYQCVNDQGNPKVRFEAVKAATSFLTENDKDQHIVANFRDLLPGIIQAVVKSVETQEDDSLLKCLVDIAETSPKFLRSQLEQVISLCIEITKNANMEDQWRHLALEVIVTLSETAPAMLRKVGGKFIPLLVPQILALMIDLEDDPEWAFSDEIEDEDNDSNPIAGESALDRLACGLGGKTMLPHIISTVPQMLNNADWRYRHGGLMAISACGEGCHKQMEVVLGSIVDSVLPYLVDQHPRVRYAACNAIGQMSTDFGPALQKKFHEKVVPALLQVMEDYNHPRVQVHAGAALINFSEDCPKNILTPYLDQIITRLEQMLTTKLQELLQKGTKLVLEQVVTTLASVADTAEEKFIQYYDKFMPSLKYIMTNATSSELKLLRGKTIECISLIGLAVGQEKFMADCSDVMQLLLKTQVDEGDMAEDDPQMSYMISAWARMCKIMGKDFMQYLPLVMGPVLKAASIKPEVAVVDNEEAQSLEGDQDWQFVTLGDQQSFGIRTAGLEEKATACQMLVCYARELKEGFAEYAGQVVKIMVPLLKFYFNDECRVAAAESLPFLIDCARINGDQYVSEMWNYICPNLLKAIETEPEKDILAENMHSLSQCIEKLGAGCLTEQQLVELGQLLDKTMQEHFERQTARQEQRKDEDYDEVVEEGLLDEDDEDVYILSKLSDVMHALLGTHKDAILPFFDSLLPRFVQLLAEDRPWPDRQWGLCIWDDVIEHTGKTSWKYRDYFLQALLKCLGDPHGEVRQAASYGIGVAAMNGGGDYHGAFAEAMPILIATIDHPDSRSVENVSPTENAISAVAKILKYAPQSVTVNQVLPHWLKWLPTWEDNDETEHIYGYLCDLVESNNPIVLGEDMANFPALLRIFAEPLAKEAFQQDGETKKRVVNILKQMQTNAEMFQQCAMQLTPTQLTALKTALG